MSDILISDLLESTTGKSAKKPKRKKKMAEHIADLMVDQGAEALGQTLEVEDKWWYEKALCRQQGPSIWFPQFPDRSGNPGSPGVSYQIKMAEAALPAALLCFKCEQRFDCLRAAIENREWEHGVFGGLSPYHRRSSARLAGIIVPSIRVETDNDYDPDKDSSEETERLDELTWADVFEDMAVLKKNGKMDGKTDCASNPRKHEGDEKLSQASG